MAVTPKKDEKRGTWYIATYLPPGPDGKRRVSKERGFATKREAQARLDEITAAKATNTYVAPHRLTLRQYIEDEWLPAVKLSLERSSWTHYADKLRLYVIPYLGDVRLQDLTKDHFNRLYALLLDEGRQDGNGGLSRATVRHVHVAINKALGDTVGEHLAQAPTAKASAPRAVDAKPPEMETWTAEDLTRFLDAEAGNRYWTAWMLLATTAMRRGEGLGVRWSDLRLDEGWAMLKQTLSTVHHQVVMKPSTKNGTGRPIELSPRTVAELEKWRIRQLEERLLFGAGYQDHDLVLCHPDGRPYDPDRFSREFVRRVTRHGLPKLSPHGLRHTWATLALEAGVHPNVVQAQLGHRDVSITLGIYTHVQKPQRSEAAAMVSDLIFGSNPLTAVR